MPILKTGTWKIDTSMQRCRNKAFTLIEVIVALAIVAIALVALLRLHLISIQLADHTQWTQRATLFAQEKLEQSLAKGFPDIGVTSGTEKIQETQLHWQVKVDQAILSTDKLNRLDDLRKVEVITNWQQNRDTRQVRLSRYIARRM